MRRFALPALLLACAGTPLAAQATRTAGATSTARTTRTTRTARAGHAAATGWTAVYTDATVTVSLDRAHTTRRSDGTYDARLKWAYVGDKAIGRRKTYRTLVEHRDLDCKTLASKPVSGETFDAANHTVSRYTTSARDLKYTDWATRPAGSPAAKAYAAVCGALTR